MRGFVIPAICRDRRVSAHTISQSDFRHSERTSGSDGTQVNGLSRWERRTDIVLTSVPPSAGRCWSSAPARPRRAPVRSTSCS